MAKKKKLNSNAAKWALRCQDKFKAENREGQFLNRHLRSLRSIAKDSAHGSNSTRKRNKNAAAVISSDSTTPIDLEISVIQQQLSLLQFKVDYLQVQLQQCHQVHHPSTTTQTSE